MGYYEDEKEKEMNEQKLNTKRMEVAEIAFAIASDLREKRKCLQREGDEFSLDLALRLERASQTIEHFEE